MQEVHQKVLVIGGTKGLGLALALEAKKRALNPTILGRDSSSVQSHISLHHSNFIHCDLLNKINDLKIDADYDYIIWSAGVFLKRPLSETTDNEIDAMIDLHFRNPIYLLRNYLNTTKKSFHLIVIASCSSWKLRECEAIYTGIKAAQATFTRNLAPELVRKFTDAKITLINPGGLNTPNFHKNANESFTQEGVFLNPDCVAEIIWDKALSQNNVFDEWQILRNKKNPDPNHPIIIAGPQLPEVFQ